MKYLVTGVAGFIGSHLARRLTISGHDVLGVDNFSPYYSSELKEFRVNELLTPHDVKVKLIELSDLVPFQQIVGEYSPDSIIHLAAQPGVRTPIGKSFEYIQNNLVAFSNVLQTAIQLEVPEFLYASSSSVYGNSTNLPYSESDLSIRPISIYGATKFANEILAPTFVTGSKTRARGMRFFTVYGPWGRPDMAYFRIIDSVLNGSKFTKFGGGEIKRDFTFIDDITSSIELLSLDLASRPVGFSDVVNIGGGNPYSLNDLIEVVSEQLNSNPLVDQSEFNPNDTVFTCADINTLGKYTNEFPKITLNEGLMLTINWAKRDGIREKLTQWINSTY